MDKKKIFILDNDLIVLKLLKELFEREDFNVVTEPNSSNICEKVKSVKPNIILMDLIMPRYNGYQAFQQLKQDNVCASVPVIILTSHHNINTKIQLLREGVLDYIYKPVRKEELLLRVKNYIHYCANGKGRSFNEDLLFNQLKEILSARNKQWLEPQLDQSILGYVYRDVHLVSNQTAYGKERELLEKWAEQKLLERSIVDIVKVCPICYHYNLSINYICPVCKSINIDEDLSTNNSSASFSCNNCGQWTKLPQIQYHCLNCDAIFEHEKIVRKKIYKYKIQDLELSNREKENEKEIQKVVTKVKDEPDLKEGMINKLQKYDHKFTTDYLSSAFKESNISYVSTEEFKERISKEIKLSKLDRIDVTVMSVAIENLKRITSKLNSELIIRLFKGIIYVILKHLRPNDILSYNGDYQKILIMLPKTHLKIAKIIAGRIQSRLDRFQLALPLEIKLASFPQDGKNSDEIFSIMELGIEKIDSHSFNN